MSNVRGPDVITLWGVGNALLVGILIGYGESWIPIGLYAGSVLLIELIGVLFWLIYLSKLPRVGYTYAPRPTRAALLGGLIAAFVGAGLVYKGWMAVPAAYPALVLVSEAGSWWWNRREAVAPASPAEQSP
jgi:hypothetical protein